MKGLAQQCGKWTFSSEVIHLTQLQILMTKPHSWEFSLMAMCLCFLIIKELMERISLYHWLCRVIRNITAILAKSAHSSSQGLFFFLPKEFCHNYIGCYPFHEGGSYGTIPPTHFLNIYSALSRYNVIITIVSRNWVRLASRHIAFLLSTLMLCFTVEWVIILFGGTSVPGQG